MKKPLIKFFLRAHRQQIQFAILAQSDEIPQGSSNYCENGWGVSKSGQPALNDSMIYIRGEETSQDNAMILYSTRSPAKTVVKIVEALLAFAVHVGYCTEEEAKGIIINHDDIWEI